MQHTVSGRPIATLITFAGGNWCQVGEAGEFVLQSNDVSADAFGVSAPGPVFEERLLVQADAVDGFVEVSANGRVICRLGSGEVVGEMAFLHPSDSCRQATVVTLEPTLFLDINSAALELSSDEVRERFNKVLLVKVLGRLREANKVLAKLGQTAVQGSFASSSPGLTPPLELL